MTEKLYYADSHCRSFTARVLDCRAQGESWELLLDKTAFFPGGGGQEADAGTLAGMAVLGLREEDGKIWHRCAAPLETGADVQGELDWPLRFSRMQFHSGEHLLSGLAHKLFGCENVGFHMSEGFETIDFDRELSPEELTLLERRANEAVWANVPFRCWFPDAETLAALPYRSKKPLEGAVRIVEAGDIDRCACCVPHVRCSGEVGLIRIVEAMRHRGGVRLTVLCGGAAYENAAAQGAEAARLSALLSVPRDALAPAVERLQTELEKAKFELTALRRREMETLAASVAPTEGNVCLFFEEADMDALRALVNAVAEKCRICAAFAGAEGSRRYIIASRHADLRALGKEINAAISGRGGGSSAMLQGSAAASREAIEAYFHG